MGDFDWGQPGGVQTGWLVLGGFRTLATWSSFWDRLGAIWSCQLSEEKDGEQEHGTVAEEC